MSFIWQRRQRIAPPPPAHDAPHPVADAPLDAIRLFPGFEREDFEVAVRDGAQPAILIRWKDGGDWFELPPMFNRSVLASIDRREAAPALPSLLSSYGYPLDDAA
ncbi:hypothetical protein [Parvularcula dongshanensis]|uniref:Uncharacterized protein n=1 Tax=Parvularcula dongshanensis TaxID=1173995 RepID=A0A840I1R4_9PROT|nr:hypothetical protein [Parvularcula dongshanensis]MBB4658128.1 hypothetical protein [Parvularcula dongshanensis]